MGNSFPPAFATRMQQQLAGRWHNFEAAHALPSPTSIRLHPAKRTTIETHGFVPWASHGRYLANRPVFTLDPLFHAGTYYVQEASSMFLEHALRQSLDPGDSLCVLDLCAAPGGKSTLLLSLLNAQSLLVSNEVIRSRASILAENIQKWGFPNAVVTNSDPEDFGAMEGFFDVMVVDAPCSGEGLFRKDQEAMQEWSPDNVALCASRQKRIVAGAWPALKENGILIYCTCTYNEAENEDNLAWLKQNHDIEFLSLATPPEWGIETVTKEGITAYRFFPHQVKGEGFFVSVMRKKESTGTARMRQKKQALTPAKKQVEIVSQWIHNAGAQKFFLQNDLIYFFPESRTAELSYLQQHVKLVTAGTNTATLKHEKLIPEHALALSVNLNGEVFNTIAVDSVDALKYLRKETTLTTTVKKGYALVTFEGVPLGWVNVLDNRINNLYPSEWRIRMGETSSKLKV